ncbi:hypothetical protein LINGRAHAP2_LOCUS35317 [Linum grandiflorum]
MDVTNEYDPDDVEPLATEEELNQFGQTNEGSFHALLGSQSPSTMKLEGTLSGHQILILVDSGSTHNFLSLQLVDSLGLVKHTIPPFGVQIRDGTIVWCHHICRNVKLEVQGLVIKGDFYPFSLKGNDVVLGIQ